MRRINKFTLSFRIILTALLLSSEGLFAADFTYRFDRILIALDSQRNLDPFVSDDSIYKEVSDHHIHTSYSDGLFWIKGVLPEALRVAPYLVLTSPLSGELTLYVKNEANEWQHLGKTGSAIEWKKRSTPSFFGAFEIPSEFVGREFLLKREGHHLLDASLLLLSGEQFRSLNTSRSNVLLFYTGAAFALLIYNLFLFFYCRERVYGLYSAFIVVLLGASLNVTGGLDYIIPGPIVPSEYLMLFSASCVALALLFSRKFVEFSKYAPRFDWWSKRLVIIPALIFASYLIFFSSPTMRAFLGYVIDISIVLVLSFLITGSFFALRKGSPMARFYLISWVVLVSGVFVYVAGVHGLIDDSLYTQWGVLSGNLGEMLFLSLALAYRMSIIQAERAEMEVRARDKERYQRLVRVLCHDISNPLSVVKNYATLMERKADSEVEKLKGMAGKVSRASLIIEELIHRVRNFEALEHEQQLHLTPVNLAEIMQEASFLVGEKIEAKNIRLNYLPEQLNIGVLAEKTSLLANVVMNALSNAIKFSDFGGTIDINCRSMGDLVELSISDHGLGMEQSQVRNFEVKGQVEVKRGTKGERGSGLGMNLMRSYMELYQGNVSVVSEVRSSSNLNSGTTVFFTFKKATSVDSQSHTS